MRGPIPVRLITVITLISLVAAAALIALIAVAVAIPPGDGAAAGFARGVLGTLGYEHGTFGAYEFGEEFGTTLFAVFAPSLALLALRFRRLWLLRTAALLWVLTSVSSGGWTLPALVVSVLSFLPPTRRFLRGPREEIDPLTDEEGVLGAV